MAAISDREDLETSEKHQLCTFFYQNLQVLYHSVRLCSTYEGVALSPSLTIGDKFLTVRFNE